MARSPPPNRRCTARNRRSIRATWSVPPELLGFWFSFFDQKYWDAVDDRIKDLAGRATKVVRLLELELGVAFGTGENLEQFLRDHAFMVVPFRPWSCGASTSI